MNPVMNTAVTRNDWVGRVIDGRFPLLEWLGSSEQAGVFRTELPGPAPRRAVIRLVSSEGMRPDDRLAAWAAAAKLSHPHLMRIFESGRTQVGGVDLLYVVTEFAEESLAQVIPERPLSEAEAREMLTPILDALSYLHSQDLVHGRIKPPNIMVVQDRLKLPTEGVQRAGTMMGLPHPFTLYDAPELSSGSISPSADIWSLGMTLAEALTQGPPLWDRSWKRDPDLPADIPQPYGEIARACLRCEEAQRATVREIRRLLNGATALEEPANEVDQAAPAELPGAERPKGKRSNWSARAGMLVGGFVVVIALIAFLISRSHKSEPAPGPVTEPSPAAVVPVPAPPRAAQPTSPAEGTTKGTVVHRVLPNVLESANRTIRGRVGVRIRVDVDAEGNVSGAGFDVRGSSRYFSSKALEAAREWKFKPAQVDGRAMPSIWMLRFEFRRSGPEVNAEEVSP